MPDVKLYSREVVRLVRRSQGLFESAPYSVQGIDVGCDPAADEEMRRLSGQSYVPTIVVDGHVLANFDTGHAREVPCQAQCFTKLTR